MKKTLVVSLGALLLLSSCGTYTGQGAYVGGSFGSIIGSAIGGIAGGWRGSDVGSLIGMAGGAAVGAAIGSAADRAEQQKYEDYRNARAQRRASAQRQYDNNDMDNRGNDDSGFDQSNSGDDRLYGFGEDFSTVDDTNAPTSEMRSTSLEIRHPRLLDSSRDGVLTRGEEARMVFEVFNNSSNPVFNVQPTVVEVTGNKHIRVSENITVESIMPGKGIRYTALIKADDRLKDGEAVIRISVLHRNKEITSQTKEFILKTAK